jgi:hypothetical protein
MEKNTLSRLKIELESFKALVIANLVGAALTMAFAIVFSIDEVTPMITGAPLTMRGLPYLALIIAGMAFAVTWITRSADLMGEHDEITKDFDEILKEGGDDEAVTGIIVRSLAFYRENQSKIDELKWGGRVIGTFLVATAVPQIMGLLRGTGPIGGLMILGQWFAIVSSVGIGAAAWYVPVVIKRFTETWDARISMADDANEELRKILEGSE